MFWRQKDWSGSEVKPCNSVYIANIFQSGPKKQLPHIIMLRHVAITLHYNPLTWFINLVCRQRCALLCLAHPLASCLSCLIVFTRHLTLKPDGGFMKNVAHVDFAEHPFLNFLFSPFKCSFCSFDYPFCGSLSPSSDKRRRLKDTFGARWCHWLESKSSSGLRPVSAGSSGTAPVVYFTPVPSPKTGPHSPKNRLAHWEFSGCLWCANPGGPQSSLSFPNTHRRAHT